MDRSGSDEPDRSAHVIKHRDRFSSSFSPSSFSLKLLLSLLSRKKNAAPLFLSSPASAVFRRGGRWWHHRAGVSKLTLFKKFFTYLEFLFLPLFKSGLEILKTNHINTRSRKIFINQNFSKTFSNEHKPSRSEGERRKNVLPLLRRKTSEPSI
ncbi:hypothetical protein MtrunA17_Chr6g0483871 [Medicago truncatula]|uniref:Uncharacterized protein n=1 Tax=Medicago truncatula TaxID=3880 RepID=A0A396HHD3_MEDTR|nr:hypothetical protein MtrunA17_Chr6g0483871 [Medicago truncatula]